MSNIDVDIDQEISELEGIDGHEQNWETGAGGSGLSHKSYNNKLFGAPYQLLDSVDMRPASVNSGVGMEYLRNFLLHSPILHVRPGMPIYTGGSGDATADLIQEVYSADQSSTTYTAGQALIKGLLQNSVFRQGEKLQRRMFGFRETYLDYMSYVNYMCRSVASMLNLSGSGRVPSGTFTANGYEDFQAIRWENYRMSGEYVNNVSEQLKDYATALGFSAFGNSVSSLLDWINPASNTNWNSAANSIKDAWKEASDTSLYSVYDNKIKSVQFMVEPVSFNENLTNNTDKSMIESAIDNISSGIGSELAFMTNSKVDGPILDLFSDLMGTAEGFVTNLQGAMEGATGGFLTNVFNGALSSLKGQKMIYPDIYRSSNSSMDYEFTVTLTSPYGDIYNYYMNIVVPLLHLIALVAPRMVTANTVTSPFLVQAYIPGMCTCQLGIISSMNIVKNPNMKHVSVNGFPLAVKVNFVVKELYNAMAISPAYDPASFLYNETLTDYLSNMAGLIPSLESSTIANYAQFRNVEDYFGSGIWLEDLLSGALEFTEDFIR